MSKDKNGQEIRIGYFVFDTYSGEYGNVLDVGIGDFDDIKVDFLKGEAYCPACEVIVEDIFAREKVNIIGVMWLSLDAGNKETLYFVTEYRRSYVEKQCKARAWQLIKHIRS